MSFLKSGKSLNTRLLLLFLIIGLLPLVVATSIFVQYSRQIDIEQSARELNGVSRGLGLQVQDYLDEVMVDARAIAALPDIRSMDSARQKAALEAIAKSYARFDILAIVSLDGEVQVTSQGEPGGLKINNIASFQLALDGEQAAAVAPHLTDPTQLVLHMHTPILGNDGQPVAILGSPLILNDLQPLLANASMTDMSNLFILDEDRTVLIEKDESGQTLGADFSEIFDLPVDYVLGSDGSHTNTSQTGVLALAGGSGSDAAARSAIFEMGGMPYLVSYKPLSRLGWTVVIMRPVDEVLTTADLGGALIGWSLLLTFVVGVVLSAFLARRISTPIRELARAANALQIGNSEEPLPPAGDQDHEIKTLIEAFAGMRAAVSDRERELRELSQTLEERVGLRTEELARINRRLHDEIYKHTVLEKELIRAKDQAEAANLAKGVFLATMSHELRTPLTAIIGYTEMLKEDYALATSRQATDDLESILRSAHHLLDIINGVLHLAKIESERMDVEMAPVNVHDIIEDACVLVLPLLESNGNQFSADIHPQLDRPVWSDELKLRQILINLLSNAAKFTRDGEIHLIGRLEEGPEGDHHILRLTISDTGIGIREDQLPQLFEPFVQLDGSRNRKYPGTGLGLALTQRLCRILEGDITVNSVYREGSTFIVTIPVQVEPIKI